MALADPQIVVYPTATNNTLPLLSRAGQATQFALSNGTVALNVGHQVGKAGNIRSLEKLTISKIAVDPFISTISKNVVHSWGLVLDRTLGQFTDAELLESLKGLVTLLSASSYANGIKLIGRES